MSVIQDEEFGKITIRRSAKATQIRLRVAPDGTLRASLPLYAPIFLVKRLVKNSRVKIREMLSRSEPTYSYQNGMQIGKSHTLIIQNNASRTKIARYGQQIIVNLSENDEISDTNISRKIRDCIIESLKIEAKSHLPKRISYLANKHGFKYKIVRFSHASSRWGSCGSNGTISLNIALMKLPFELIDYVIIHELAHTVHMNHGKDFWQLVATANPDYKIHRHKLKLQNPSI